MKVYKEMDMTDFEPWSGAVDTYKDLERFDRLDQFQNVIEELYPDGCEETTINDILWFEEPETIAEWVGLYVTEDGELTDEEPEEEEEEEDEEEEV